MSKKGFLGGKNSNAYIVFYSTVMVVIVAVLLAFTSLSLKEKQNANVLNEKKDAIVASLGLEKGSYDSVIEAYVVNKEGEVINTTETPLDKLFSLEASYAAGEYPVFENKATGELVFPVTGKGLWETPGLGAEIATPKYQAQFPGKTIYEGSKFVGIEIVKGGAPEGDAHSVDAVTGGTKTSEGLENMIKDCLGCYDAFIMARTAVAFELVSTENAE